MPTPSRGRTSLYFDLLEGFQQPGCTICRYSLRAVERFFDGLTYENTNDYATRDAVRAARGFCNRHTGQYLGFSDELGTAIICRDLLHTVLPAIAEALPSGLAAMTGGLTDPDGRRAADRALKALAPREICLACRRLLEAEEDYLSTLLRHHDNAEFGAAFAASTGLCVLHAGLALQRSRGARQEALRRTLDQQWADLLEALDGERSDVPSAAQALTAAVGGEGIRP